MMKKDSPLLQKLLQLPSLEENYPRLKKFPTQLEQLGITLADGEELAEIATNKSLLAGTASEFFAVHYALFALGGLRYVEACPKFLLNFTDLMILMMSGHVAFQMFSQSWGKRLFLICFKVYRQLN